MAAKKAPSAPKPAKAVAKPARASAKSALASATRALATAPAKVAKKLVQAPSKAAKKLVQAPSKAAKKPLAKRPGKALAGPADAKRSARSTSGKAQTHSVGRRSAHDVGAIAERLARAIPEATCELRFTNPFELLIATILSAQSTDKMVNAVMPTLLERYPDPKSLAEAEQEEVEALVKRTGFFRNKAKSIRGAAQQLVEQHEGRVPKTLEALVELPGVARKTANVVLGTAYRITTGVVVDTHVTRVSQRLALTAHDEAPRIEDDLCGLFPRESWIDLGHRLVLHGRYTCLARNPLCTACPLNELCPSRLAEAHDSWEERADQEASRVSSGFASSGGPL